MTAVQVLVLLWIDRLINMEAFKIGVELSTGLPAEALQEHARPLVRAMFDYRLNSTAVTSNELVDILSEFEQLASLTRGS